MATRFATVGGASALPFDVALSVIPSLPRPLLARFVARAIERLDWLDGDCDLEDGDDAEREQGRGACTYGIDQREITGSHRSIQWSIDQ